MVRWCRSLDPGLFALTYGVEYFQESLSISPSPPETVLVSRQTLFNLQLNRVGLSTRTSRNRQIEEQSI